MKLTNAEVGPFRSINTQQTLIVDPEVTVLVGMNEAGKTVILKALEKSNDALGEAEFFPVDDYPRKDLSTYLRRHDANPDVGTNLTYCLSKDEIEAVNEHFGAEVIEIGATLSIVRKYDNKRVITVSQLHETLAIEAFAKTLSAAPLEKVRVASKLHSIPELIDATIELTEGDKATIAALQERVNAVPANWHQNLTGYETWTILESRIPPFLYFSDYDLLPGKTNLVDLEQRVQQSKTDGRALTTDSRAVLALLRMADVSVSEFTGTTGYESMKAKIEGVSINLTDQVMEFWKQNEDLEVEVDIKPDPSDIAPFNNGPNLYLRIRNRRHRGVSTSFDQRSRGFIWFFSFLVWFDSVQHQLDPNNINHQELILLLDEPGLALHALAQADFLRYIDNLATEHQVIYTTHSPFMVHSDRLHQVRLVEDKDKIGTVILDVNAGSDERTIFPLQAALGWTVAQNLFINERNLLVEGPSELLYLQMASDLVEASGGTGLRHDLTIVPTGGLDKVVTFIALLGANSLQIAVLHDYAGKPQQKLEDMVRQKLLSAKALFNVSQFRDLNKIGENGPASDIEDLFDPSLYLAYFQRAFVKKLSNINLSEGDLPPGDRIVDRIERMLGSKGVELRAGGGFNHYTVAAEFGKAPPELSAVSDVMLDRFKALFEAINAVFK